MAVRFMLLGFHSVYIFESVPYVQGDQEGGVDGRGVGSGGVWADSQSGWRGDGQVGGLRAEGRQNGRSPPPRWTVCQMPLDTLRRSFLSKMTGRKPEVGGIGTPHSGMNCTGGSGVACDRASPNDSQCPHATISPQP